MTRGEIWKDFLKHTVLTLVIALFLFLIFKSVFYQKRRNGICFMSGSVAGFPLGFGGCLSGWFPMDMT